MRIVFDHQIFSVQEYGGISRYFCEVARRLVHHDDIDLTILAPFHVNGFLRERRPARLVGTYVPPLPRTARLRRVANDAFSRAWLARRPRGIVHETYYRAKFLGRRGDASVVTVYDMVHERYAEMYPSSDPTAAMKAAAVRRADAVICISEATRNDVLELLDVDPDKVRVVHLAYTPAGPTVSTAVALPGQPYVLYVGHRRAYKNFPALLRAVSGSAPLRKDLRLVCFGGGEFTSEERAMARSLGFDADTLIQLDGDDQRLSALYTGAAALVYPSLYEGFGIPVLEAMAHGCPVACSGRSSFPEVAGDAAELFDPTDISAIAAALERIILSPSTAAELRRRAYARLSRFSWERCARETRTIYASLA